MPNIKSTKSLDRETYIGSSQNIFLSKTAKNKFGKPDFTDLISMLQLYGRFSARVMLALPAYLG